MLPLLLALARIDQLINEVRCLLDVFLPLVLHSLHCLTEVIELVQRALGVSNRLCHSFVLFNRSLRVYKISLLYQRFQLLLHLAELALELLEVDFFVVALSESLKQRKVCLLAKTLDHRSFDRLELA